MKDRKRGRRLGSINRRYRCTVCGEIRRTFPAISHHLVVVHNGEGFAEKRMPYRPDTTTPPEAE